MPIFKTERPTEFPIDFTIHLEILRTVLSNKKHIGELMADVTALKNEVTGLVSDQAAFNAKVDGDLSSIASFIASLQASASSPSQADLDALQQQVAAVRASLTTEGAKVDAAVPVATPATPAQ